MNVLRRRALSALTGTWGRWVAAESSAPVRSSLHTCSHPASGLLHADAALPASSSLLPSLGHLTPAWRGHAVRGACLPSHLAIRTYTSSDDEGHDYSRRIIYPAPEAKVTAPAPYFMARAVVDGEITLLNLDQYDGKYVILFFYPKDFTFVCPTEIIAFSDRAEEFRALNCELIAVSTDTEECHLAWIKTPRRKGGLGHVQIPILADTTKEISAKYGVLLEDQGIALRGLFIINPLGIIEHITINNAPIGRSVDEALRTLQAIQFVAEHGEVCPADWKPGGKTMHADPEKSLEYFESASGDADEEWGTKIRPIMSEKEFKDVTSKGKVVLEAYAPWCGKCRQITPYVEELQEQHPEITFVKLDTTAEPLEKLAASLGIKALPSFRLFKDGERVGEEITGYKKRLLGDAVDKLAGQ